MHYSLQTTKRTKLPFVEEAGAITVPRPYDASAGSGSDSDADAPLLLGPKPPRPRSFKFLTFAERVEKVDIDVHRRPVAAGSREPAEGAPTCNLPMSGIPSPLSAPQRPRRPPATPRPSPTRP